MLTALHRLPLEVWSLPRVSHVCHLRRFWFAGLQHSNVDPTLSSCPLFGSLLDVDSQSSSLPVEEISKSRELAGRSRGGIVEGFYGVKQRPPHQFLSVEKQSFFPIQREWVCFSCVRGISSSVGNLIPRNTDRYSGRELDRDSYSKRHAKFDENFKRLPAEKKKPLSEYRQATVDKSTKNIVLVPKKWKRAIPTKEAVDAVMYLRRAKVNKDAVKEVMRKRIARLLRLEMMMVLLELQRIDECYLARQVFNFIRVEPWYKPDLYLYQTMVDLFGKNKQMGEAIKMCEELREEGLQPDGSFHRTLLKGYVSNGMIFEAIELYKELQKSELDRAARSILFHGLNAEEKLELAEYEKKQGYDWS